MTPTKLTIRKEAKAGLDDKGDALIHLAPGEEGRGIQLDVESKVETMFGDAIRKSALEVLGHYKLTDVKVTIRDKGALDYALRARLKTAIERALKE